MQFNQSYRIIYLGLSLRPRRAGRSKLIGRCEGRVTYREYPGAGDCLRVGVGVFKEGFQRRLG